MADLVCSPGCRTRNSKLYLSDWYTWFDKKGNTLESRIRCWKLAKENVNGAVGIRFNHNNGQCNAIDNSAELMPWPDSFPDAQENVILCILREQLQSGNVKYNIKI